MMDERQEGFNPRPRRRAGTFDLGEAAADVGDVESFRCLRQLPPKRFGDDQPASPNRRPRGPTGTAARGVGAEKRPESSRNTSAIWIGLARGSRRTPPRCTTAARATVPTRKWPPAGTVDDRACPPRSAPTRRASAGPFRCRPVPASSDPRKRCRAAFVLPRIGPVLRPSFSAAGVAEAPHSRSCGACRARTSRFSVTSSTTIASNRCPWMQAGVVRINARSSSDSERPSSASQAIDWRDVGNDKAKWNDAPAAVRQRNFEPAAHQFNLLPGDGQTEPGSARAPLARSRLLEWLEYLGPCRRVDAGPGIVYLKTVNPRARRGSGVSPVDGYSQRDRPNLRELHRVSQEVDQRLSQPSHVGDDPAPDQALSPFARPAARAPSARTCGGTSPTGRRAGRAGQTRRHGAPCSRLRSWKGPARR